LDVGDIFLGGAGDDSVYINAGTFYSGVGIDSVLAGGPRRRTVEYLTNLKQQPGRAGAAPALPYALMHPSA
jgi:hypothetical protein